jgi:hypothetical protein
VRPAFALVGCVAALVGAWGASGAWGALGAEALSRRSGEAAKAEAFDLAAIENGGRVEWASSQTIPGFAALNLIAGTSRYWVGDGNAADRREEIVFSFFSRQSALVSGVQINPFTLDGDNQDRPKDVEIWTSTDTATTGFVRAGAATLKKEDALQSITFPPVEARYVSVHILNAYGAQADSDPGHFAIGASRVKILEGARAGYASILARNPELASVLKGIMPGAPATAVPAAAASAGTTCAAPVADAPARKSTYPQSRNVLVVAYRPQDYKTFAWKFAVNDAMDMSERAVIKGVTFSWMTPTAFAPAQLVADPKIDTVVFGQVCGINDDLSPAGKQGLLAWVAAGHKLILQDSDFCAGANDTPKYPFMPYPFATVNPGAAGAAGIARILENSTLASANPRDAGYIDVEGWMAGLNDLGDSNVVVEYDAHWCGAMWAQNKLGKNGFALAYAHYGRGLIIYDGVDFDQYTKPAYRQLQTRELMQPFDADYLQCSQPLGGFIIAAKADQKSRPMAAGHTYTYPLSILGNFGYTGKVTLEAGVMPADPAISVKLDRATVDLTKVDEASASLTVTTSPTASIASKVITVRGKDTAGKSNRLCLDLPERRTGGLTVLSGLRKDKKPTRNLEIILDASGSMKLPLGKTTRWATALDVLADVVGKLPADYSVGLRTYGHREASTSPKTCTDTELVVDVAPLDRTGLVNRAKQLRPRGETPLVYSILQTPDDLKALGGGTVILITDGEESCKGDFTAAAKTLKDSGLNLTLNIVGFTLKAPRATADLGGLAESTGGHYYGAQSGDALARAVLLAAVDQLPYRILDAKGAEVDKGVAGVDGKHELPPGDYKVVVNAGDESLTMPVTLALRQDVAITVGIKDDRLIVEK